MPIISVDMWHPPLEQPQKKPKDLRHLYPPAVVIDPLQLTLKEPIHESNFHPSLEAPQRAWALRRQDIRYEYPYWVIDPKQLTEVNAYITGATGIAAPAPAFGTTGHLVPLGYVSIIGVTGIPAP